MTLGLHQQKCKMLKIITLLLLVGDLGLRVLWFYLKTFFFFFSKFKSLKCTVSLRLLYSWVAVDCLFVWCLQHSGWSWNKGCMDLKVWALAVYSFLSPSKEAFHLDLRRNACNLHTSLPFSRCMLLFCERLLINFGETKMRST